MVDRFSQMFFPIGDKQSFDDVPFEAGLLAALSATNFACASMMGLLRASMRVRIFSDQARDFAGSWLTSSSSASGSKAPIWRSYVSTSFGSWPLLTKLSSLAARVAHASEIVGSVDAAGAGGAELTGGIIPQPASVTAARSRGAKRIKGDVAN